MIDFDQLEWPWKRHICEHRSNVDFGLHRLTRRLEMRTGRPSLGLVAGAYKIWTAHPVYWVAVQELADEGGRFCLKLSGNPDLPDSLRKRERVELGSLVVLCKNGQIKSLHNTAGLEFQCIDQYCSPEEVGIPPEWNGSGFVLI